MNKLRNMVIGWFTYVDRKEVTHVGFRWFFLWAWMREDKLIVLLPDTETSVTFTTDSVATYPMHSLNLKITAIDPAFWFGAKIQYLVMPAQPVIYPTPGVVGALTSDVSGMQALVISNAVDAVDAGNQFINTVNRLRSK